MVFVISPVKSADIPALTAIQWAALQENPLIRTLYPRGLTPAIGAFTTTSYQKVVRFNSVRLIKAVDEDTGEIIAFAKWIIFRKHQHDQGDRTDDPANSTGDETKRRRTREDVGEKGAWKKFRRTSEPPDCYTKALRDWNDLISRTRRGIMQNRQHTCPADPAHTLSCYFSSYSPNLWVLDILHTHPTHQGRGAGTQLVKWGTDMADEEGLPCYLESSPAALSLFTFCGFDDITEMSMNLGNYRIGQPEYKHVVMLRPPYGYHHISIRPPQLPPKSQERLTLNLMDEDPDWVDTISEETVREEGDGTAESRRSAVSALDEEEEEDLLENQGIIGSGGRGRQPFLEIPTLAEARMLDLRSSSSTGSARLASVVSHSRSHSSRDIRLSSPENEIRAKRSSRSLA